MNKYIMTIVLCFPFYLSTAKWP